MKRAACPRLRRRGHAIRTAAANCIGRQAVGYADIKRTLISTLTVIQIPWTSLLTVQGSSGNYSAASSIVAVSTPRTSS